MDAYRTDTIEHNGHTMLVQWFYDQHTGAPWEECDGHGPVSEWTSRAKRPGEWVLSSDGRKHRYYDAQKATQEAKRDGWNTKPYTWPTKGAQAAAAVLADYEYLRRWCDDQWHYCGISVTLLDEEGNETHISHALWSLESEDHDYHQHIIQELADECDREAVGSVYAGATVGLTA
jgi:hypothetical protein